MLNVGVIGLGNIAQKAYLPTYATMQDTVQWYLDTRDLGKLTKLANQFRLTAAGTDLQALDSLKLDAVMIHAATPAHYTLVKHFLERDVNVYVDKPLATTKEAVQELYMIAAAHRKLLTVGFNRRFAPMIQELAALPNKNVIQVVKNRVASPQPAAEAIFDLLIHPLDTALMLAGFPSDPKARYSMHADKDGNLEQATITFAAQGIRVEAGINMVAGANLEEATVSTTDGVYRVQDLSRLQAYTKAGETTKLAPDWQPTLETRGFAPAVRAFLTAIQNQTDNPVAPESSRITHQLLADMVAQLH
ncbi:MULTISPECIES: Gfo/Idh/MocA family protein [unclassified Lacticaseibacillus]|uniref:Gfo/Idh/MocA family protein n=1 Tax=unclassified Lacticaseibacillus TaxID=2759744 RepID=UPI001943963B|nr:MULTISPECIES: Gfo/Idh/MocA family oxidoreductase [unclassified Lacticaseibacillus]